MWPILVASVIAFTIAMERLFFLIGERARLQPRVITKMLSALDNQNFEEALRMGKGSKDFVARLLTTSLQHRDSSISTALLQAANRELARFHRGLDILDTIITLAPLLGLLGTVTGMIHSFGLLGTEELGTPAAITGGIAEALIATAFGLGVAIIALIPYNYFNSCLEKARLRIQDAALHVEICCSNREPTAAKQ